MCGLLGGGQVGEFVVEPAAVDCRFGLFIAGVTGPDRMSSLSMARRCSVCVMCCASCWSGSHRGGREFDLIRPATIGHRVRSRPKPLSGESCGTGPRRDHTAVDDGPAVLRAAVDAERLDGGTSRIAEAIGPSRRRRDVPAVTRRVWRRSFIYALSASAAWNMWQPDARRCRSSR